ncbi:tetratricopeptide repeat protein [Maribacter sp. MMG018]|uniref:tetratricopeptide repeat protein n=1 Tax=Maribacter sp. MMG018 TaxID=2822688 RepID=UPI001B38D5ED|nr:tetratricopeptide repeat protein [Maribacter sp. MMG018]MBQ4915785.1 tetratricopeptide repeat protein [Maribacter sp. MMG018]
MDKEQLLYNYFSDRITPEEQKLLDQLLETDKEFRQQFNFENDLKQVIREKENSELKSRLVDFEDDIKKERPIQKTTLDIRKWAIAASVALVIGLGWLGYNTFSGPNYGNLYEDNFQEYPNTVYAITRGEDTGDSQERKAFMAYETDNTSEAIALFTELKQTQNTETVNFYLAQSYLKISEPKRAIDLFDQVIDVNGEFLPQALWYRSLAYLKLREKEKAMESLEALVEDGRYKKPEAIELLGELE